MSKSRFAGLSVALLLLMLFAVSGYAQSGSSTVQGTVKDPQGNTKAGFEIDTVFDRKDFNITWNQYFDKQGVLISDQVKLHCDVQLLKLS